MSDWIVPITQLVETGARVTLRLLSDGYSMEQIRQQLESIRPHQAGDVDDRVDTLLGRMPEDS